MDNGCALDLHTSDANNYKQVKKNNKTKIITNWLNSIADDDADSIMSDSTAFSSSIADSEDIDFNSFEIGDADSKTKSITSCTSNPTALNQRELLQKLLNESNNVQTVGDVNIANSSHVRIGNVTYITGPIHITNPSDPYMKTIFNENTKIINTKEAPKFREPLPAEDEEEEAWAYEEARRDDAFLKNINRRVAENVLRMVDRRTWLAQKPMEPYVQIKKPVEYVIISHSATEMATTQADNIYIIRNIQCFHVESRRWNDIGYNFMIGGDGNVYEGRGWGVVGAHAKGYNTFSLGINFIGCFMRELPPAASLTACKNLIKRGVEKGHIAPNYKLIGHCQCSPTESPGRKLFEELQTWPNFAHDP